MKAIYFTTNITFQKLLLICNKTKLTEKRVLKFNETTVMF